MKNDFGGHDNWHTDNVYAYVGQGPGLTGTLDGHEDHFERNKARPDGMGCLHRRMHLLARGSSDQCPSVPRFKYMYFANGH